MSSANTDNSSNNGHYVNPFSLVNQGGRTGPVDQYSNHPPAGDGGDSPFYKSAAPSISLPKGGGALKGIDEKFSVNAVNGTAGMQIPLPLSPGRGGFSPSLALSYNSGSGNSEFGLGWGLSLPSIQRKTDKKLPRYNDGAESDIFLLAGAEDLVPVIFDPGTAPLPVPGYTIKYYRPRIEGLFARIEYISEVNSTDSWWRVTTKDNITTYYGLTEEGRLADPEYAGRIFKWLPQLVVDHKGNVQQYSYMAEDDRNVTIAVHEKNRLNGTAKYTNTYLKRVQYCNEVPYFIDTAEGYKPSFPNAVHYLMEAVLDYGDHSTPDKREPDQDWDCRSDAFSAYQSGFEIRTYRLCRRVLLYHHFHELAGNDLVRSLELGYAQDGIPTGTLTEADYIQSATQRGYEYKNGTWHSKALPAMTFDYEPLAWDYTLQTVERDDFRGAPQGLTGPYQWIDFEGEGLSGILTEQGAGWLYKSNLGDGHFTPPKTIAEKPSFQGLADGRLQWQDLDADGRRQVVSHDPVKGFWELDDDQRWQHFQTFSKELHIDWNSPFTKMLDLNGDGKADVLVTEDYAWTWWENLGKEGFGMGGRAPVFTDEEEGPMLLLRDPVQSIFLADMSGDGMTDLVRIKNGEVCYWPNKGYGRFGAKVTMGNTPEFHSNDQYNPQYLTLADISGTGAADLIYIGNGNCSIWVNLSGNGFGDRQVIGYLPATDPYSKIAVLDFLGNGTGCLVWSSPLPRHEQAPLQYMDLMGGKKPYLMRSYSNGMGKTVSVTYKSSTQFYLADKLAGKPWATRLPFPVHCIHTMTASDSVSQSSFTQSYKYRHGYYDHEEREFRGFGYVETLDTDHTATADNTALDQAPVLTKTWYHTGAWMRSDNLLNQFKKEYYPIEEWDDATLITGFPVGLNAQELREAYRALKGLPLRQEVYALDGSVTIAQTPYTVTASAYTVKQVQKRDNNRFAAFLAHQQQSIIFSCERNPDNPRIVQELTLETDDYGNVLQSAQVAYPRKAAPAVSAAYPQKVKDEQERMHITCTRNRYTNDVLEDHHYRLRLPYEAQTFELLGIDTPAGLWTLTGLLTEINAATPVDFSATATGAKEKRLLSHTRTRFKDNTAVGLPMSFGSLQSRAIPHGQYQLAVTGSLRSHCYGSKVTTTMMEEGGYADLDGNGDYWLPSGAAQYADTVYADPTQQFFTPVSFTDPWNNITRVSFGDAAHYFNYWLLPEGVTDAIGNESSVERYNWRNLQPERMKDANDNYSEMLFDALGLPVAMALLGKDDNSEGDSLSGLDLYGPDDAARQNQFFDIDPDSYANELLGNATWRCVYDLDASPVVVGMIARQHHVHHPVVVAGQSEERIVRLSYTDGMGRIIMHKAQCEGTAENSNKTWIGSGRIVYNNKGKAVMQYEPYFSSSHRCDTAEQASHEGVSPKMYYDPLDRLRRTDLPDGSFTKTEWTAWQQVTWDNNDTVEDSAWYTARIGGILGTEEQDAAQKASAHYDTPTMIHTDSLARPFYTIQQDSAATHIHSYVNLDIVGNRLSVIDGLRITGTPATDMPTLQYRYNLLQQVCYQDSIDSGEGFILTDIAGQPLYAWDADDRKFRMQYDQLRRMTHKWLNDSVLLEAMTYGEGISNAASLNLKGQVFRVKDGAGTIDIPAYDFKGNPVSQLRTFTTDATAHPDWSGSVAMESSSYQTQTLFDALNRPIQITTPDHGITTHVYERSGSLYSVRVDNIHGMNSGAVNTILYDTKGQRRKVQYANGTTTVYTYDPQTFRVTRIRTTRHSDSAGLQDLHYWYDPVGNITLQKDGAQQAVYFNGSVADPESDYTYDALYRLVQTSGREHAGNNSAPDNSDSSRDGINPVPVASGDTTKMRRFTQYNEYDAVGNFVKMSHTVTGGTGNWTRYYTTDANSNRMTGTMVGSGTPETYTYDNRGNITGGFAHIGPMVYNASNRLEYVVLDSNRTAWYQYDSAGQRVRKTIIHVATTAKECRIYDGAWEVYRKFDGSGSLTLERETLHISDDTGCMALIDTRTTGSGTEPPQLMRYQYSNHLGSAALELDDIGAIISYEEYYPYGSTSFRSGRSGAEVSLKRYRYTGKERDEESGLYYHGARYYIPWLARWTACDPLESKYAGMSAYNYSFNNPVMFNDPSGADGKFAGTGTSEDPYVVTANYYYYDLDNDQAKALNKAIGLYNNEGKAWSVKVDGKDVFVKLNLSTVGKDADGKDFTEETAMAAVEKDTIKITDPQTGDVQFQGYFGNVVTANERSSGNELGEADSISVKLKMGKISSVMEYLETTPFPNEFTKNQLMVSTFMHELGHNLGGIHGDKGNIMSDLDILISKSDINGNKISVRGLTSSISKDFIAILVSRINKPYGTDYNKDSDYVKDMKDYKEDLKKFEKNKITDKPTIPDPKSYGTNGRITTFL